MTLTEFLTARYDEDEMAAIGLASHSWIIEENGEFDYSVCFETERLQREAVADTWRADVVGHIARHDPARVLREVEAKRKILADFENQAGWDLPEGVAEGRDDDERECDQAIRDTLGIVLADFAAIWSDHPDYREEWTS